VALVALLDANVLWSAALRDTLLLAAEEHVFRPVWTRQILDEMSRSLTARRPNLDPARVQRTVDQMLTHFPECLVERYEHRIAEMHNDLGDRHVLAAAVQARSEVIVTWNKAHFPSQACIPYDIEVQDPDEFLCDLWSTNPEVMAKVLTLQAQHLVNPPRSIHEVVETLGRQVPQFAQTARSSGLV
jgi:predicted nucleic acid-binding protein